MACHRNHLVDPENTNEYPLAALVEPYMLLILLCLKTLDTVVALPYLLHVYKTTVSLLAPAFGFFNLTVCGAPAVTAIEISKLPYIL